MSLLTNLEGFWKLEESSGLRLDAFGSNDLTDNNTVGLAPGIVGNSNRFINANAESLSIVDNTSLSTGDIDFFCSIWAYLETKTTTYQIMSKYRTSGDQREWGLQYSQTADRYRFFVSPNGQSGTVVIVPADTFGSPSTKSFHHIVAWHDSIANTINIVVNNGPTDSLAHTSGVFEGTGDFVIGALDTTGNEFDGRLDAAGFWKRIPTAQDRADLFNKGHGLEHPFTALFPDNHRGFPAIPSQRGFPIVPSEKGFPVRL